ncbi:MAG: hypothetical protein JWQ38_1873 [Flavipsychrobacter sp.]|nr:hypothetical protein [Flavipsychrobacter sp.]
MKTALSIIALLLLGATAQAQVGSFTVDNRSNPCNVLVYPHGTVPSLGSTDCKDTYTNGILVAAGSLSVIMTDPTSRPYALLCGSGSGTISSIPSDFQWTMVTVDYQQCPSAGCQYPAWAADCGDVGVSCYGVGSSASIGIGGGFCAGSHSASWAPAVGSALSNITLTLF